MSAILGATRAAVVGILALLGLACLPAIAAAQELPAIMVIDGIINSSGTVLPQPGDSILVRDSAGKLEGTGSVADDAGGFFVQLSKTAAFNDTELGLTLQQGGLELKLLEGTEPFKFRFAGGFPLTRLSGLSLTPGDVVAVIPTATGSDGATGGTTDTTGTTSGGAPAGTATGGDTAATTTTDATSGGATGGGATGETSQPTPFDVDGDGRFSQTDIDFVKKVVAGRAEDNGKADTNNDRVVNTRDIIEMIKAYRLQRRPVAPRLRPGG